MKIALYGSIAWKHPFGISQALSWAQEYGWDCVDARGLTIDIPGGTNKKLLAFGYDMLGPRQIRPTARQQIRRQCEEIGVPILGIYCPSPVNLGGELGTESRTLFREFVRLAADMGVEWIRAINNTTTSYADADFSPEEAFERTVAGLKEVGAEAQDLGVGVLLENNENTTSSSAADLLRMQAEIGEVARIGIAYDAVNAYFQGLDPIEELEQLAGKIDILHLKNVKRHRDPEFAYLPRGDASYEWTALADGDLDWRDLLGRARAGGFDGPLTFEYVNPFKGMPPDYWNILREPDEAARVEAAYLRGLLKEL